MARKIAKSPFGLFLRGLAGLRGPGSLVSVAMAPHAPPGGPPCHLPSQASGLLLTVAVFPEKDDLEPKAAVQKELSDMDYLKSKVVRAESPSSSSEEEDEESEDEAVNCDEGSEAEEEDSCTSPARQAGAGTRPGPEQGTPSEDKKPQEARAEVCVDWGVLGLPGR